MRKLISGAFILLGLLLLPYGANAALIQTDNFDVTVQENQLMKLDFAIEYTGSTSSASEDNSTEASTNIVETVSASSTGSTATTIIATGSKGDVIINEFVSDPVSGEDEWVELFNTSAEPISIEGWYLQEGSEKQTSLEGVVAPNEYKVIFKPKGSLNNGGDLIQLYDNHGVLMDDVVYGSFEASASSVAPAVSDPDSVGLTPNGWSAMTPSPGGVNIIPESEVSTASYETSTNADSDSQTNTESSSNESTTETTEPDDQQEAAPDKSVAVPFVKLSNITSLDLGSEVTTEGVVSAIPGVLGKQLFYIAGSGIQVYLHSAEFPALDLGMRVRLQGVLSQAYGERRLKLTSPDAITKLGTEDAPTPHDITSGLVGEPTEGWLVRLTGTVSEKKGSNYTLTDSDGEARMTIKSSTEIIPSFSVGDEITVVGIVSQTSSGHRILPRNQNDILIRTPEDDSEDTIPTGTIVEHNNPTKGIAWALAGLMTLFSAVAVLAHHVKKRRVVTNPA